MTKEEMIKELIEDMCNKCTLFKGKYDAMNGNELFMNGVGTVMEYLAYCVSEEYGDNFSQIFVQNMIDSEDKIWYSSYRKRGKTR